MQDVLVVSREFAIAIPLPSCVRFSCLMCSNSMADFIEAEVEMKVAEGRACFEGIWKTVEECRKEEAAVYAW